MPLFISDEEYSRISHDPSLISQKADAFISQLYNQIETEKAQCSLLEQKYVSLKSQFFALQSRHSQLKSDLKKRVSEVAQRLAEKYQIYLQSFFSIKQSSADAMENVQVKVKEKEGEQNEPSKRIKTQQTEEGEDRISSLPDCLILEILSRLPETKHAIRTGTLSKRWQRLWPSVPCLSFYSSPGPYWQSSADEPSPDFYLSVDKTLTQCRSTTNLSKFQVSVTYDNRFKSHVDSWIHFSTGRNVQQFDLHLMHTSANYREESQQFVLEDDCFFINPHFTHLSINHCLFNPTGPISWNNLTHLTISYGKLDNDFIDNMLSGSPLLDTLRLDYCYCYSRLDITSKSVKNLSIDGYEPHLFGDDVVIEINAPYISSLTIKGELWLRKILLRDMSSLVKAELNYYLEDEASHEKKMLNRLLLNLRHVKELKIGYSCYKAFAYLDAKGILHPSHLKGVDVTSRIYSRYLSKALVDCCDNDSSDGNSFDTYTSDGDSVESGDSEEPVLDAVN